MSKKPKLNRYAVWFDQVNQVRLETVGVDKNDAIHNARIIWRRDYAQPHGAYCEQIEQAKEKSE